MDLLTEVYAGQWVDVKDTIDQWLEAQIIKTSGSKAFIHYNGWGARWDEWIELPSARMKLFRSHTIQQTSSSYTSPSPNVLPDAENTEIVEQTIGLDKIMNKLCIHMTMVSFSNTQVK